MTSDNWAKSTIDWYLSIAGERVTAEHYSKRIDVCRECPFWQLVEIPGARLLGCGKCGCPSSTKPWVRKYFSPTALRVKTVVCPIGKWQIVDKKFNQNGLRT